MLASLEEKAKQYVYEQDGQIQVNWETLAIFQKRSQVLGTKGFDVIFDNILKYLRERGSLVYDNTPGSYFATGFGIPLNPRLSDNPMIKFSFANEQNAREYYMHFFRNAQSGIILHQTIGPVQKAV